MGFYTCTSACGQCGRLFCYNPHTVPSLNNVAFCRACMNAANSKRIAMGLDAHPIHPTAYEPVCENDF